MNSGMLPKERSAEGVSSYSALMEGNHICKYPLCTIQLIVYFAEKYQNIVDYE